MKRSVLVFLVLLAAGDAFGHAMNIFVRDEGGVLRGTVKYSGGEPAEGVTVTISSDSGDMIGEVVTGADGKFEFAGTRPAGTAVIVAATPDGHRAEAELRNLPASDGSAPRLVPANVATVQSYEAQLTEIHAAIDQLENRLWLRDIVGGIGYIFGAAGLWALWKARASKGV